MKFFISSGPGSATGGEAEYAALVETELVAGARGEMGESADGWKVGIAAGGDMKTYICESFCDTAAWLYSGVKQNRELTLAARWKGRRRAWFDSLLARDLLA